MSESSARADVAGYSSRLHARGWVANHDGNITLRLGPGRFLATPTATSKAAVRPEDTLTVDDAGAKISGGGKPFSELGLHLAVMRLRPDVHAVIHAHPPTATGFSVAGVPLDRPIIAEAVVSLGAGIPTVPFAPPGAAAARALEPFVRDHDAVVLANHGVLSWGVDLEQAYLRMELVEHLARITLVARQLGAVQPIPESALPALLEARAKAGLGPRPAASGDPRPRVIACAPAPSDAPVQVMDPRRDAPQARVPTRNELATIIRQEIASVLGRK